MNLVDRHLAQMPIQRKIRHFSEEIELLESRIKPNGCGHLHTTIYVLKERITELQEELQQLEVKSQDG